MTYTLVADGGSDKVLIPILNWSLRRAGFTVLEPQWADFSRLAPQRDLAHRLETAMDLYPCDALFVHRDAEGFPSSLRREEIAAAARGIPTLHVPVVPVRMTEAWLLADEQAIRRAAGNPKGKDPLSLPDVHRLEDVPDPKSLLYGLLRQASGLNRRRLSAQFRPQARVHGIPNYTGDYSRLDALPAFRALQADIRRLAESLLTA